MKLVTFLHKDEERIGALDADCEHIIDLAKSWEVKNKNTNSAFKDMIALMNAGEAGLEAAQKMLDAAVGEAIFPLVSKKLLSPVPVPSQIRDFSVFEQHLKQCGATVARLGLIPNAPAVPAPIPQVWYDQPLYYKGNRFTIIGTDMDVEWPYYSDMFDYELEIGVFIGKKGRDIKIENARNHIFGYSIYNDFSARDAQLKEMMYRLGPAKGKDFDTGNAIGPWIVTKDEMPDPFNLDMIVRVNGEERGRGNTSGMNHSFEAMIAHVSRSETLQIGEFLGSGTCGNGCGLELGRFLENGDVVELEIEKIGILRNRVLKAQNPN